MADSDSDQNVPDAATAQKLVKEFEGVTNTDEAFAQFSLQEADWDLSKALNNYFTVVCQEAEARLQQTSTPQPKPVTVTERDMPETVMRRGVIREGRYERHSTVAAEKSISEALQDGTLTTRPPESLTLVSWNIDGLDQHNLRKRTKGVCMIIEEERADIVFLQEVIPDTLAYIREKLPNYHCITGPEVGDYFVATLLRRGRVYWDGTKVVEFPTTLMDRHLLAVSAHCGQVQFDLLNTHLESTKEHAEERKRQLKTCLDIITKMPSSRAVIYGGDLNMRDYELAEVGGLPPGTKDCWEACGSRKEVQYTWDLTRNSNLEMPGRFRPRCRFDRVYLRGCGLVSPQHFGLIGLKKIAGTQSFPSDHWGILVKLSLDQSGAVGEESANKRLKGEEGDSSLP